MEGAEMMNEIMEVLAEYLPLLIPLVLIQLGLLIAALIHIFRHDTYRTGSRAIWVVISIFINIVGPILYFTIGKGDE
jgi:hypothetical protein